MTASLEITVEEDKCVASGQCVMTVPEVFDQRVEDGVVILLDARPPAAAHDEVRAVVALCPAAAIRVAEGQRSRC
ncbi:ferredoxin [Streptomyces sp. NPDC051658]|uniref:ferredoxin n=1 Tax=Streptomyces sp. NPDC051658 TaxID=3365667 RepID=UPI0037B008F3